MPTTPTTNEQKKKKDPFKRTVIKPDGTVEHTIGGVTRELDKSEQNAYLSLSGAPQSGTGTVSQDVKDLVSAQETEREKRAALEGQRKKNIREQAIQERAMEDVQAQNQGLENQPIDNNQFIDSQTPTAQNQNFIPEIEDIKAKLPKVDLKEQVFQQQQQKLLERTNLQKTLKIGEFSDSAKAAVTGGFIRAAQVYDVFRSGLSSGKQTDVKAAEANLADAKTLINLDIEMVKKGLKNPSDALNDFELALNSLRKIEESQRGLGKLNLRYWLTGGKEIETQLIIEQRTLEYKRLELLQAAQIYQQSQLQTQIAEAKASYGL